jgi:uncharacterized protein
MPAISDLQTLLKSLSPTLQPGEYVYCSLPWDAIFDPEQVIGTFREAEGLTLILPKAYAQAQNWEHSAPLAWISLTVHSDLEAVGLTAAFSQALGQAGISCNVVAAFYHDHIFVPLAQAGTAMAVLKGLAERAKNGEHL